MANKRTLFGHGEGLPIRNITVDPLGGEMRKAAEKFLRGIDADVRFYCDDAVIRTK